MSSLENTYPITFLLVGCDDYDHLERLSSVREDLDRVRNILCLSEYSLYVEEQIHELYNGTSQDFREKIKDYLYTRSAERDVLVLYFSGHGTAIGRDDFGFCMKDAFSYPSDSVILPTSVVKLSEIMGCLNIQNISLIIFVDACYSGQVSRQMLMKFPEISHEMSKSLIASMGSDFGLVTACADNQQVLDIGVLSKALIDFCEQGADEKNKEFLTFGDMAEILTINIDRQSRGDSRSRVFIPPGRISKLKLCKNIQYHEPVDPVNIYSFTNPYLKVLIALWNNGHPVQLTPAEILEQTGSISAYANHNKLSLECWELVTTNELGERIITDRGIQFLNGKLSIPKIIVENKNTRKCVPAEDSPIIKVIEKKDLFGETDITFSEIDSRDGN